MKRDVWVSICAAWATLVAGTTASFSASSEKPGVPPGTMTVPVYFLDGAGKPVPPAAIPEDLTLELGAIPGGLGGRVGAPLQTVHIGRDKEIQLDLADLSAKVATRAAQFGEGDGAPVELSPEEAKFARVSTVVSSSGDTPNTLAVTFWDPGAKGGLTLLYCDRPCRLRASSALKSEDFDFEALSAGLAWMLTRKDRHSRFIHRHDVSPHPAVVICPPEALDNLAETLVNDAGRAGTDSARRKSLSAPTPQPPIRRPSTAAFPPAASFHHP